MNCQLTSLLLTLCAAGFPLFGQGTLFRNLGFESASLPPVPVGEYGADVSVSQGLPGWTVQFGSSTWPTVKHNG